MVTRWRTYTWAGAALLLVTPAIAMLFTGEVRWGPVDFLVFGSLLLLAGGTTEFLIRRSAARRYQVASGLAVVTAFLLTWLSLGVGLIGADGDPANLMYAGVLATGIIGSFVSRFEPRGMAITMAVTALSLVMVAGIALVAGLGAPVSGPVEIVVGNGIFAVLFAASSWLFGMAFVEGAGMK